MEFEQFTGDLNKTETNGLSSFVNKYINNDPLYFLVIPYCLFQPLFGAWAKYSSFYETNKQMCKKLMTFYNLFMSVFSLVCAAIMIYCLWNLKNGVYAVGHFDDALIGRIYSNVVYIFYISKYVEFLDTYFLLLCGRPVIWLQYLHHIGAPIDMGLVYHWKVEGAWIFVAFNGLIHTVMYYYYACAIMKWKFPLPKKFVTWIQLIQFVSGHLVLGVYYFVEDYWNNDEKRFVFLLTNAYVFMNLIMFINFYRTTYAKSSKKTKEAIKTD